MAEKKLKHHRHILFPLRNGGLKIVVMGAEHPGRLLMNELKELDLPAASLYRMLVTLTEPGYIVKDNSDRYHLAASFSLWTIKESTAIIFRNSLSRISSQ